MSQNAANVVGVEVAQVETAPADKPVGFVRQARLISGLTLVSRVLGVVRESLAAKFFGAGIVASAFAVAFTIPNLFRKLFGEGALSAAFIPLYAQSLKNDQSETSREFAAATVNLLIVLLGALTVLGEIILWAATHFIDLQPDRLLAVKLTAIMLPYALLVCGMAFLSAILQVHRRFGWSAATPIVLNVALILGTILGARFWDMKAAAGQTKAVYFLSAFVLVAGVAQVLMLLPSLAAVGFRFDFRRTFWTPAVSKMVRLSMPVAIGAGVLQLSVLLDRGISFFLASSIDRNGNLVSGFEIFGHWVRYPMELGAVARLNWAQYLYQFPLGVFAIALATAIFPTLSADALDANKQKFIGGLRRGIRVTLWEGLPASIGLLLVARPAVQLLFERGNFTPADTIWVTKSVQLYALGIWAFSLNQILSRAFFAMHDTITPLVMAVITLVVNLLVELPLIFTPLKEAGMAAGTTVSFIVQVLLMLWLLRRRLPGLGLRSLAAYVGQLGCATGVMMGVCSLVQKAPFFPADQGKGTTWLRLGILVISGAAAYLGMCKVMGIGWKRDEPPEEPQVNPEC
ncbi:MAG TPA: murein biosynthesis integral membrane protein MurJ [Tepidisphaeraceae bacterium]|jgi:putative peptidoglycan lipid II flippase|nr:murein biosynthesis integral membrane protein MurJ [Tepidisphaeraceae bacterium]